MLRGAAAFEFVMNAISSFFTQILLNLFRNPKIYTPNI